MAKILQRLAVYGLTELHREQLKTSYSPWPSQALCRCESKIQRLNPSTCDLQVRG